MPRNTRLKPYTTRMAKIQGPKEGKTYSNIYKQEWIQPWPMGSEIYHKVHENPRAFFSTSSPILLKMSLLSNTLGGRIASSPHPWKGFDLKSQGS